MRADLTNLTDADLKAVSNALALKRARKELHSEKVSAELESDAEGGLVVRWSDEVVCTFPAGSGIVGSSCTCPARKVCRHRVRSVMYLRALEPEPTAEVEEEPLSDWSPAQYTDKALRSAVGAATYRKALKALRQGIEVEQTGPLSVSIPMLGVRIRFVPEGNLEAVFCSCGSVLTCEHRVMAALSFRETLPETVDTVRREKAERQAREGALQRVEELLAVGLDGIPAQVAEALDAQALRARSFELPGPSRDLTQLARQLRAYHQRSARFSPRDWLWTIGRVLLRLHALSAPHPPGRARVFRGEARRGYLDAESLDVVGLGAEGFASPSGTFVKLYLLDRETGAILTSGVGRQAASGMKPRALWRSVPVWGELTPRVLSRESWRLIKPRRTVGGRLASGGSTRAQRLSVSEPELPWELAPRLRVKRPADLVSLWEAQSPPLFRSFDQSSILAFLEVCEVGEPVFDAYSQALHVGVQLVEGGWVTLRVRHKEATDHLVQMLEKVGRWARRPVCFLARCRPSAEGAVAFPIAVWLDGSDHALSLSFDSPTSSRSVSVKDDEPDVLEAGEEEDGELSDEDEDEDVLAPGRDAVSRLLARLLSVLEGLSVGGLWHGAWRAEELESVSFHLEGVGLSDGARCTRALASRLRLTRHQLTMEASALSREFGRLLLWTITMQERWQLEQLRHGTPFSVAR